MANYKDQAKLKTPRTQETWARIERAREHYKSRAERRLKGQSRSDATAYNATGRRRPATDTLTMRQVISGAVR